MKKKRSTIAKAVAVAEVFIAYGHSTKTPHTEAI